MFHLELAQKASVFRISTVLFWGLFALAGGLWAQSRPFPQNVDYGHGFKPTNFSSADVYTDYIEWKNEYVINVDSTMQRVAFDKTGGPDRQYTVSEGQAYGMLIAAYLGDRPLFDKLLAFYEKWQFKNTPGWHGAPDGLMSWKVSETGASNYGDSSPATDADEDAILALLVAYEQWGAPAYREKALKYLAILKWYVQPTGDGARLYLKPGNWGPGTDCAPDYHAPAWYRVFAEYSGDGIWTQLANDTYRLFDLNSSFWTVNLVSDFCAAFDGTPGKSDGNGKYFASDACRAPWRLGMDYLWFGDSRARAYGIRFADFATSQNYDIRSFYPFPNATPPGWNQGSETDGAFAVAAMAKGQAVLNSQTAAFKDSWQIGYYQKTLRVIYGLALTGNLWRPTYGLGTVSNTRAAFFEAETLTFPGAPFVPVTIEAEASGNTRTGVNVLSSRSGFSGTGYVAGFDAESDELIFRVNLAQARSLRVVLRVAAPGGAKQSKVSVNNGADIVVSFPSNANWADVTVGTLFFNAGPNTVKVSSYWGWYEVDALRLSE
jgi:endo-1,4-beta-D-glucanase Y